MLYCIYPYSQIRGAKMGRIFEKYKADRIDFQDFDQDWRILELAGFLGYPIRSSKTFQSAVFDQDFTDLGFTGLI
jgi:hypothetical protein